MILPWGVLQQFAFSYDLPSCTSHFIFPQCPPLTQHSKFNRTDYAVALIRLSRRLQSALGVVSSHSSVFLCRPEWLSDCRWRCSFKLHWLRWEYSDKNNVVRRKVETLKELWRTPWWLQSKFVMENEELLFEISILLTLFFQSSLLLVDWNDF